VEVEEVVLQAELVKQIWPNQSATFSEDYTMPDDFAWFDPVLKVFIASLFTRTLNAPACWRVLCCRGVNF
jgi:hypothetical protein